MPRHGGADSGTVNNNIVEKEYTLKISNYIKRRLDELGIENSMTRTTDEFLDQSTRPSRAQSFYGKGNDVIIVSNHLNAGGGDGAEIIYSLRNNDTLSRKIANEFENAGQNVRKYFQKRLPSNPSKDYYYLLRNTPNNETIIVEYGFTDSSGDDVNLLKNNWETLSEAVVKALANYIGVPYIINASGNNNNDSFYTVKKGDSLWSIAKKYNVSVNELMMLNNLSTTLLQIGQKIKVKDINNSGNNYYIVQKGDSLWKIASLNNTNVNTLKVLNNLSTDVLQIGQKIIIPTNNKYIVQKGDSLWKIASLNNTTVSKLKQLNNLSTDILQIGQEIILK